MNVERNKNKKFLSSVLCALLCSSNSSVSSMIVRPNLAEKYNDRNDGDIGDDDGEYGEVSWENINTKKLITWLGYGLLGFAVNKKLLLSNSSIADDISSGFQKLVGYKGGADLAKVLNLSYAEVAEAVSLGGKKLDAKWARDLEKLAGELNGDPGGANKGWVKTVEGLSTYWKLACSVKTDLDLEFGKNTGAVLKKLISNRSYLGTPLVVDKETALDNNDLIKPFTEDGGFKNDGLSTFEGDSSDYWFAGAREFLVNAKNSRGSLFSVNSAMLQTYHFFYERGFWEPYRCGKFNNEGNPNLLPSDTGTSKCIYEDKQKGTAALPYINKGKWAWKTDQYIYVRVPSKGNGALNGGGGIIPEAFPGGNNVAIDGSNIPIYTNVNDFINHLTNGGGGDGTLKNWLGKSNDFDSKQNHCRYIAIPI